MNVWTPELSTTARLPVLVYFHGGSNTQGYSQMTPLGPPFSRLGLVVVSANYRLGPFGFLALPALTAESTHNSSGNYGLLDQVQALRWVRENISRFGGDPHRVTVMGQSAGAVDVCLLMSSPLAAGLFQRAIMESGECQSTLNEDIRTPLRYNSISTTGEGAGDRLTKDLGLGKGPDALRRLRSISAAKILTAWSKDRKIEFGAIVDGWVVPRQPAEIFAKGQQMKVPVLVGSNADEATVFGGNDVKTLSEFKDYLRHDTGEYANQEFQLNPAASDADVPGLYLQLENDSFAYGAYSLAQAMTHDGQNAYLYYFTYVDIGKRAVLGAHHGEELFFLSDSFPASWKSTDDDGKFGELIRRYWAHFAETGDPNVGGLPHWPAFKDSRNESFQLGRCVGIHPVAKRIQVLAQIMHKVLAGYERAK